MSVHVTLSFKMASKPRVASTVVASEYFQKHHQRSDRERWHRSSESEDNETDRYCHQPNHQDDKQPGRRHMRSRRKSEREYDRERDKKRRGLQSEHMERVSVFDRLSSGFSRNQQQDERQVVEVETDPCDVPRGKRYFEHDDRNADRGRVYTLNRQNNRSNKQLLRRQRSRSPVWKHDRFGDRREKFPYKRRGNRRSPVWKHDKFEEQEIMENRKNFRYEEET